MKEIKQLDCSTMQSLITDINNLCTHGAHKEFLDALQFLRDDPTSDHWSVKVGYCLAFLVESDRSWPAYILKFTKNNQKHYLIFYIDDDIELEETSIFMVKVGDSIDENAIKFN